MRVGSLLHRFPLAWNAAALGLRVLSQPRRSREIDKYLRTFEIRKLRLGAGRHTDPDWLSADLVPLSWKIVFMDARKPLPLPSDSFDFIECEHMIEHVNLASARRLLSEFHRILRPNGVLRLATPDLERLIRFVADRHAADDDASYYVTTTNKVMSAIPDGDEANPVYMINRVVRDWGHQFLYDEPTLTRLLEAAGFRNVVRCAPHESEHPELVAVDRHHEETGERMNRIETLLLEATPGKSQ
jgi:predicted SAM-dependent methyltransferase